MELTEQEHKELKRFAQFDKKWRTMYWMGWIIAFFFSLIFIIMGIYIYVQLLPRLGSIQSSFNDDLKMAYSLWCYTFILLGFSSFISGYLMINYCKDIHILYSMCERTVASGGLQTKPSQGDAQQKEEKPHIEVSKDTSPEDGKDAAADTQETGKGNDA